MTKTDIAFILLIGMCVCGVGCTVSPTNWMARDGDEKARHAEITFFVVDTDNMPLPEVKIYCSVTKANLPPRNVFDGGRFIEAEEILVSDNLGSATIKENKCITIAVYKVKKDGYEWQRDSDDTGHLLFPVFGFSLYTSDNERYSGVVNHTIIMKK